jgi:hypothetical protein
MKRFVFLIVLFGVTALAHAETVTEGGAGDIPAGANALGGVIDNAAINLGVPLVGLALFIGAGIQLGQNIRTGAGISGGPVSAGIGGLVVAGAPQLISSSMTSLSAATMSSAPLAPEPALVLRDPVTLGILLLVPVALMARRRARARRAAW